MKTKTVQFDNGNGLTLTGLIDLPPGKPVAFALFAHCFTCTKNLKSASTISQALTEAGIATLRFDFTGLGQSEGDFATTSFSSNVEDLLAAANFLEENYKAPKILIGHSLGGTAVLQAARDVDSAIAVATIGSPARPEHVAHLLKGSREAIERDGEAVVKLGGRDFKIRKQFLDDLQEHDLPESVHGLRKALLIFHSPIDSTVEIDNASELYRHALHPKSFVSLDNADHLLSRQRDSRYVGEVLASWATRYLGEQSPIEQPRSVAGAVVARTHIDGFFTKVNANAHTLVADEPESVPGGTNRGPSPYDLLAGALATCTSMTLKMYATHKKLPVTDFTVSVHHSKIHAEDCEHCETNAGKIDKFERTISYSGELSDEQRERLLVIADKCPVHATLHSEIDMQTSLNVN